MLDDGQQVLAAQPFSVLLGGELVSLATGRAEIRVPVRDEFLQQQGAVHGGVISYAADSALTFAAGSMLGPSVVTSEFKINYLWPAKGAAIVARATVVHCGRSQAVCRCEVFMLGEREILCATAQGTIVRMATTDRKEDVQ